METLTVHLRLDAGRSLEVAGRPSPTCAGKRGARFVVIALAAYLLWSGRTSSSTRLTSTPIRRSRSPMVLKPVLLIFAALRATTVTVEPSPWASQVHCPNESGRAGRDRDPVA
jgi:hypothetical protein